MALKQYPIGIQTFERIRKEDKLYIDKTEYVYSMTNCEGHYQQVLFIIFTLLTHFVVDVEVHTPDGQVDVVMLTDDTLYIIELKLNRDAHTAMQQTSLKQYDRRFALCGKPTVKVGINFDAKMGNIEDWEIA